MTRLKLSAGVAEIAAGQMMIHAGTLQSLIAEHLPARITKIVLVRRKLFQEKNLIVFSSASI
jgi:hypothetical protein